MRYWWVNQNQTFEQETQGGYLWSPKRNANNARNPFYEFMREVSPGDIVFSFARTFIPKFGIAKSHAYEAPKPAEFGDAGRNWNQIGWRIDVSFEDINHQFRPRDWFDALQPHFPNRYAPLDKNGNGKQGVYLTELPESLAAKLGELIGGRVNELIKFGTIAIEHEPLKVAEIVRWEEHLRTEINNDNSLPETEREALVLARRGQGKFRENVFQLEKHCRVTKVDRLEHLRASHCKPWRDAEHAERLDGENGLLLTPSIDHLFDRGFISFADKGDLLIAPVAHRESLTRMGIPIENSLNVGTFTSGQKKYLEYHRDLVFLKSNAAI